MRTTVNLNNSSKVRELLLWLYVAAVAAGILYAACAGLETTPAARHLYESARQAP